MTDQSGSTPGVSSATLAATRALRLRGEGPRVTRLSRNVLIGGAALVLIVVCGALLWALQTNRLRVPTSQELYTTERHTVADGLAGLPRDYAGVPRNAPPLSPPLPGDLGRPIVSAQAQAGPTTVDPDQQRRAQHGDTSEHHGYPARQGARQPRSRQHEKDCPAAGLAA